MKNTGIAGLFVGLLLASSPSFAAKTNYKADIEGGSVGSPGTGIGNFTFDDVTKRLCGKATYAGLTGGAVTVAAFKEGDTFTIVKPLPVSASPLAIDVTLSEAEASLLGTGPIYIAIGNAMHDVMAGEALNGEVNGELVVDATGVEQPCVDSLPDGGVDSGPPPDAAAPASSDDGGSPSAPEVPVEAAPVPAEPAPTVAKKKEDGGCSTSGSSTSGIAIASVTVALLTVIRRRRASR